MARAADRAAALHRECEAFLYREAELLDSGELHAWFDLLTTDIDYRVPVRVTRERAAAASPFSARASARKCSGRKSASKRPDTRWMMNAQYAGWYRSRPAAVLIRFSRDFHTITAATAYQPSARSIAPIATQQRLAPRPRHCSHSPATLRKPIGACTATARTNSA